jgi:hypothetical protein
MFMFSLCKQKKAKVKVRMPGRRYNKAIDLACLCPVSSYIDIRRAFHCIAVPEFIDPVFTKTSPKRSFSLNRKRAFWLVFAKTGSIISGTGHNSPVLWIRIRKKTLRIRAAPDQK